MLICKNFFYRYDNFFSWNLIESTIDPAFSDPESEVKSIRLCSGDNSCNVKPCPLTQTTTLTALNEPASRRPSANATCQIHYKQLNMSQMQVLHTTDRLLVSNCTRRCH